MDTRGWAAIRHVVDWPATPVPEHGRSVRNPRAIPSADLLISESSLWQGHHDCGSSCTPGSPLAEVRQLTCILCSSSNSPRRDEGRRAIDPELDSKR